MRLPEGVSAARVSTWFRGQEPWPCTSPERLALLKQLEGRFQHGVEGDTHESRDRGRDRSDKVFITSDEALVEESRLLPLAMAADISSACWSGPGATSSTLGRGWAGRPRAIPEAEGLSQQAQGGAQAAARRAQERAAWVRTIDRVNSTLTGKRSSTWRTLKID